MKVTLCRNGAYWLARWRDEYGALKGKSLGKRDDAGGELTDLAARMICTQMQLDLEAGLRAATIPTVGAWVEAFLALRPRLADRTADIYRYAAGHFMAYLGTEETRLSAVTPLQAAQFAAWLTTAQGLQASTIALIIRQLKSLFRAAERLNIITRNPWDAVKAPQGHVDRTWASVPLPTLERLLEASTGPWRGLLALCRLAALRVGEARRLKWAQVDLVRLRLIATSKGATREVPIVPRLAEVLFELSMTAPPGEERVCPGVRRGELHRYGRAVCLKAGVEPWRRFWHTLRKACERDWAEQYPVHVAAAWAGNSPAVALKHYLKPSEADFARASAGEAPADSGNARSTTRSSGPPQAGF